MRGRAAHAPPRQPFRRRPIPGPARPGGLRPGVSAPGRALPGCRRGKKTSAGVEGLPLASVRSRCPALRQGRPWGSPPGEPWQPRRSPPPGQSSGSRGGAGAGPAGSSALVTSAGREVLARQELRPEPHRPLAGQACSARDTGHRPGARATAPVPEPGQRIPEILPLPSPSEKF